MMNSGVWIQWPVYNDRSGKHLSGARISVHILCVTLGISFWPNYIAWSSDSGTGIVLCSHYIWIPDAASLQTKLSGKFLLIRKIQNKIVTVTTMQASNVNHLYRSTVFIPRTKLHVIIWHDKYAGHNHFDKQWQIVPHFLPVIYGVQTHWFQIYTMILLTVLNDDCERWTGEDV